MPDLTGIVHDTIHVEHRLRCAPSTAFAAYADVSARAVWTVPSDDEVIVFDNAEFRIDGTDVFRCGPRAEPNLDGRTTYLDIVHDERIIAAECISQSGMLLAASIVTWTFTPDGSEVIVAVTDQVTSLVGHDMIDGSRIGYGRALANLATHLAASVSSAP
jgi:uncharacterized protein YndB with AHSA1/START domain